jgi:hypothetical protein
LNPNVYKEFELGGKRKKSPMLNRFINGSNVSTDIIIRTTERKQKDSTQVTVETLETIKEQASGFIQGMELLTVFDTSDGKSAVFVFMREIIK